MLTVSIIAANATQSVGYKLWDSNNGYTATLDPALLTPPEEGAAMVQHVQIKFDDVISIVASNETLAEQILFSLSGRELEFSVNANDATILDITMTSGNPQASSVMQIQSASEADSLIAGIHDSKGNPVKLIPINTIQPTGLALEKLAFTVGTASEPASVTYRLSSIPLVRSMNFLQVQSSASENANGFLAQEYFTIHSHSYYTMTAATHLNTLATAATDTLQKTGYTFEVIEGDDADNPRFKTTALTPTEGEELSWRVYAYPHRSAADHKFELAQAIETSEAEQSVIDAATAVLYNPDATAAEVLAAIASLGASSDINQLVAAPSWKVVSATNAIILKDVTIGSAVTVYSLTGHIVKTFQAKSVCETIPASSGIYIVRVGDSSVKTLVK